MKKKHPPEVSGVGVVDDVVRLLNEKPYGVQPWYKRIQPEHAEVLAQLAQAWKSGRLGRHRRTAARAVSKILKDRGIANVGFQGVDIWLQRV